VLYRACVWVELLVDVGVRRGLCCCGRTHVVAGRTGLIHAACAVLLLLRLAQQGTEEASRQLVSMVTSLQEQYRELWVVQQQLLQSGSSSTACLLGWFNADCSCDARQAYSLLCMSLTFETFVHVLSVPSPPSPRHQLSEEAEAKFTRR
jgi:hypothetical protein